MRRVVADSDQLVEAVAQRRRQPLRHALRQQGAGLVPGRPHRTAQHRVGRRENVFVAEPAPRPRQQGRRAVEPQRFVFEEPRQPFAGGGVERAQTKVLTDALLMLGDRLLPALVGVNRLGIGPQSAGPRTSGSPRRSFLAKLNNRHSGRDNSRDRSNDGPNRQSLGALPIEHDRASRKERFSQDHMECRNTVRGPCRPKWNRRSP